LRKWAGGQRWSFRRLGQRRIRKNLNFSNLFWADLDVAIFAGAEVEPRAPLRLGVMIAAQLEAIAQRDALGGEGEWGESRKDDRQDENSSAHR
jgi:hypothetical protein